jgi:hypothetical protein
VIYYHMKVVNDRPFFKIKNCQVRISGISLRGPDGHFNPLPIEVPPMFVWSPAGFVPPYTDIAREQIFDFGCVPEHVSEGEREFKPVLLFYPNNFQGAIRSNQSVRYTLEVIGDNLSKRHFRIFEVAWNGEWTDHLDVMERNLPIREVNPEQVNA